MQKSRKHSNKCNKKQCRYNATRLVEVEGWYYNARDTIDKLMKEKDEFIKSLLASREERLLNLKGEITRAMAIAMESLARVIDERHLGK